MKSIFTTLSSIIIVFVAVSLFDLGISVIFARFYTGMAFIISFGVGGIFAAVLGYGYGMEMADKKNSSDRWSLILFQILTGLASFFLISKLEGGEYEAAFKSFGAALALGSLLFIKKSEP